jgi:hypothetical protein
VDPSDLVRERLDLVLVAEQGEHAALDVEGAEEVRGNP